MAKLLYRIGKWSFRAKWLVVVTWLVILAAVGACAVAFEKGYNDIFSINDTPAKHANELYMENFPEAKDPLRGVGINIVFAAPEGEKLDTPKNTAAVQSVIAYLDENLDGITDTMRYGNPVTLNPELQKTIREQSLASGMTPEVAEASAQNLSLISEDGRIGYTAFELDVPVPADVTDEQRAAINKAMDIGREQGITVEAGGSGFGDPIVIEKTSEIIGLAVAAFILIFTFGSLVAAGLPLISALFGVGIGSLATTLATAWLPLNTMTPVLAVMLGLAVGIDYSLFIIFRYRRERERMVPEEAAGMAVGTAGSAVVFAGVTVIIALVALGVANIPFLTYIGWSAALTVFLAVAASITVLPALLGIAGNSVFKKNVPFVKGSSPAPATEESTGKHGRKTVEKPTMGKRWITLVHKFPGVTIALVIFALGALTIPAQHLHLSLPSDTQANRDTTQRKQAELMAEGFGPGINSPFLVIVDAHNVNPDSEALAPLVKAQDDQARMANRRFDKEAAARNASFIYTMQTLQTTADVKFVQLIGQSKDGQAVQMLLTPESSPEDYATNDLISSLRIQEKDIAQATGVKLGITGLVPVQQDVTNRLSDVMPLYLAIVVGLAILLLMVIFRSIWVPIVAGIGFLLSIGAAFGVTVMFWQEGLGGLVNTPGPIIAFMPIFLIGVCFGLAMDYQVFLVSAMREDYTRLREKHPEMPVFVAVEKSVISGFVASARVVTAAALIMISVFVAFIGQPLPFIKIFGFALGAGVLFDAFFVRMAFVPACMFILGRYTWWMPRWLDKILPHLDIEGTALERAWEERQHQERDTETTRPLAAVETSDK